MSEEQEEYMVEIEEPEPMEEPEPEPVKPKKKGKELPAVLEFPDWTAVAADGLGIHVIQGGKRRCVPDTWTQTMLRITMDEVVMLFPEQLLAIPEGKPMPSQAPAEPLF